MIAKGFRLPLLWLLLVLLMGSAYFGPQQTQSQIVPALRAVAPWLPASGMQVAHALLRKLSHVLEYALLALFWLQAFRSQRFFTLRTASWAALAVCLVCAVADEAHQAMVPGRHGSVRDIALDSLGAIAMIIVVRSRNRLTDAGTSAGEGPGRSLTRVRLDESA
jgi:VanZ family protein